MEVFISWSGDRARVLASALRRWLPAVIQSVRPWISHEDIDKGSDWSRELRSHLEKTDFGILILTPENVGSAWLLFESGALSKHLDSRVCGLLHDIDPTDLRGPLAQFQHAVAEKDDVLRLLGSLNAQLGDGALDADLLEDQFELRWPELEDCIAGIPTRDDLPPGSEERTQHPAQSVEMTREILQTVRRLEARPEPHVEPASAENGMRQKLDPDPDPKPTRRRRASSPKDTTGKMLRRDGESVSEFYARADPHGA